jgi:hypothetical protein
MMMTMTSTSLAWTAAGLTAGWCVFVVALARMARPRRPRAAAATPALGAEPPAVVNLLTNRGVVNAGAAVATLLDLAARRVVELHQPHADRGATLLRVRTARPAGLRPYEARLLDRLLHLAGDGWLPLSELARSTADDPLAWSRRFAGEVEEDARGRGLVRDAPFGLTVVLLFVGVLLSCVVGGLLGAAVGYPEASASAPGAAMVSWPRCSPSGASCRCSS